MLQGNYFVYITTNPGRMVLYTGVTNDLEVRLRQHYENRGNKKTFADRYYCYRLLYHQRFSDVNQAIDWEKKVKNMSRAKKEALIRETNPRWDFLLPQLFVASTSSHCHPGRTCAVSACHNKQQ